MGSEINSYSPATIWLVVTAICALSGLPVLLRSKDSLAGWHGLRLIVAAVLWHGLLGLCITLLGWEEYKEHRERIVGVAIFSGLFGQIFQTHGGFMVGILKNVITNILAGLAKSKNGNGGNGHA